MEGKARGQAASITVHYDGYHEHLCRRHVLDVLELSAGKGLEFSTTPAPPGTTCIDCESADALQREVHV